MSTSSRVKLPGKQTGRRKSNKRSLVVDSGDELDEAVASPSAKRQRIEEEAEEERTIDVLNAEPAKQRGGTNKRKRKPSTRTEEPDDEEEAQLSDFVDVDDVDDDFDVPKKQQRLGKGLKDKGGKAKTSSKKTVVARDERKIQPDPPKPAKPALEVLDGPDSTVSTPVETALLPKEKPKLPTIKKNKPATVPPKTTPKLDQDSLPTTPTVVVRTPAANVGVADFDLRNENVYKALFSSASSRAGHIREEERRKELNKLRDEARAKRAMEANQSFDLQEQMEKILRYEQKLRPVVLYPNILAARWKDDHEHRRKGSVGL